MGIISKASAPWNLLSTKIVLDSPWLRVHQNSYSLPNGSVVPTYYISEHVDSTLCVCFTGERFVMVRQYRAGIGDFTVCHPGGRLEAEDASPLSGALREVLEETGYQPVGVQSLGTFGLVPGISTSRVHMYLVECSPIPGVAAPDATEDLRVQLLTREELMAAIDSEAMNCAACVAATYRALNRLGGSETSRP